MTVNEFPPSPLNDLKIFMCNIWGCCVYLGSVVLFNASNDGANSLEPARERPCGAVLRLRG